jgi:hypothetical protein
MQATASTKRQSATTKWRVVIMGQTGANTAFYIATTRWQLDCVRNLYKMHDTNDAQLKGMSYLSDHILHLRQLTDLNKIWNGGGGRKVCPKNVRTTINFDTGAYY